MAATLSRPGRRAALACVAATLLAVSPGWSSAQDDKPVKIGFMATLSGPLGPLGQDAYDAFSLAIEANGGKLGGRRVELIREDDHFKVDEAVQKTAKFTQRDKVDVVVASVFSNVMMAIQKPINDAGTVLIAAAAGPTALSGPRCHPLLFNVSTLNESGPEALGQLMNEHGVKSVFIMAPNYEAGLNVVEGFKRFYKGKVSGQALTTLNQPDYQAELAQARGSRADAVFAFYFGAMAPTFVKQFRQAGMGQTQLYTFQAIDSTTLPAIGDAAVGTHLVNLWNPDLDTPANKRFVGAYRAKYKRTPMDYGARAYDAALMLDAALRTIKGPVDANALRKALREARFESVRGKFALNPQNQWPVQDYYAIEVVRGSDGKPEMVTRGKITEKRSDLVADQCKMPPA